MHLDQPVGDRVAEQRERERVEARVARERTALQREVLLRREAADAGDHGERDHPRADDRAYPEVGVLARVLRRDGGGAAVAHGQHRLDRRDGVDDDLGRGRAERHERRARHVLAHVPPHAQRLEARHEVVVRDDRHREEAVQQHEHLDEHAPPDDDAVGVSVEVVEAEVLEADGAADHRFGPSWRHEERERQLATVCECDLKLVAREVQNHSLPARDYDA